MILSCYIPEYIDHKVNIGVVKSPLFIQNFVGENFKEEWLGRVL